MKKTYPLWLACSILVGKAVGGSVWTVDTFPDPDYEGLIADPDNLLSESSKDAIFHKISTVTETSPVPLQIALAVASKMDIQETEDDVDEERVAEAFARQLHDR